METAHAWSSEETSVLLRAACQAPRRWLDDDWTVRVDRTAAVLVDHAEERRGRARVAAAGGILANVEVAMRAMGWVPETSLGPGRIARVGAKTRAPASRPANARYRAMFGRSWYRGAAVPRTDPRALVPDGAGEAYGVRVVPLPSGRERTLPRVGGQVRRLFQLAEYRDRTRVTFLVTTAGDRRRDLVRAGLVAQYLRLGAIAAGLGCTVLAEPFAPPDVRGCLAGTRDVPGIPQLLVITQAGTSAPAD